MFASKVIIVTGSSAGIGAGTAVHFAREGASGIVLHGRNVEGLKKVKQDCENAGKGNVKVHTVAGEITDAKVRENLINETINTFGRLDVLVNNAGIMLVTKATELPLDLYDKIFDVNVRSVIALTQLAIPHLIKTGGNVVNISSGLGVKGASIFTFYSMSKAALDHFSRCLAVDLGPKGVRVNSLNSGEVHGTELVGRMGPALMDVADELQSKQGNIPLRRAGTVDEIADAIVFLASDKAKFITGTTFLVDGGYAIS